MPANHRAIRNPYGHAHRKMRAALLPDALGTVCPAQYSPRCTGLMIDPHQMHLDHSRPAALGGTRADRIVCAPCNLSMGAALGNQLRAGAPPAEPQPVRERASRVY